MVEKFGSRMTVLHQNLRYNKVCYKVTVLYIE